jgi:diaminopimelate decarboxylase
VDYFRYKDGRLFCEDIDLERFSEIKTPFYLYSWNTFKEHFQKFEESFSELNPLICFAVKTCNNTVILNGISKIGAGMDIVSGGELFQALRAGTPACKIVFAGVGKTVEEIEFAIDSEIGFFNIESEPEFVRIKEITKRKGKVMKALLRVNPDEYDAKTHEKTTTGKKGGKFGVDYEDVMCFFDAYANDKSLILEGLHVHIGSPIYSPEPYVNTIRKMKLLIEKLKMKGHSINYLDIGGGFAADYEAGASPSWKEYATAIVSELKDIVNEGIKIIIEPGRTIAANAGILVCSVQYVKKSKHSRDIIIVDTGFNHLVRPALYGANHFIWSLNPGENFSIKERRFDIDLKGLIDYDIAGMICESGDYLARDRKLPAVKTSDRLAIFTAGAYGMVMASQYNSQPRPAEYMIDKDKIIMIRERETYNDLIIKQTEQIIL